MESLGLPREARVLELTCGGDSTRTLPDLAESFSGPITCLGLRPPMVEALPLSVGARVTCVQADPFDCDPSSYDVVVINPGLAGTSNALSRVLPVVAESMDARAGLLIYSVWRTQVAGRPAPGLSEAARSALEPFFELNFGTLEPSLTDFLAPMAAYGLRVESVKSARDVPEDVEASFTIWTGLKRQRGSSPGLPGYRSTDKAFALSDTVAWLTDLAEVAPVVFPETFRDFVTTRSNGTTAPRRTVVKHDIHHDLRRTVRMAEEEAAAGIFGVYFMMGRHELNAGFFDDAATWARLRHIAALGHRIGLHLDVLDTLLEFGDLYEGVETILGRFAAEGLQVRYGNCHGNTKLQLGIAPTEVFQEYASLGDSGSVADQVRHHVGRYALHELADQFGLTFWLDSSIRYRGEVVAPTRYVSDNSGALVSQDLSSPAFAIDTHFVSGIRSAAASNDLLVLLHPQYYAPAPRPAGSREHQPAG